jgi:serine/threonine protein kinase
VTLSPGAQSGRGPQQAPPPGLTVGGYTLLTRLGEGGMGVVHLARKGDGPRVALKVLRPHIVGDDEARARLAREVSSLSRIRSRWVAEIVDADPWGPVPFVATRYVPGFSLHDQVQEEGPVQGADLIWLARSLAEGIASVHAAGVLHRDVKPSNVLMEGRTPILIDFGLARVADDPKLTHTGWLLGTPGYLPPEILHGDDATPASDVHSWAATVAYAALGRSPYGSGPSMAIMDRVRRGDHDLSGLPDALRQVIEAGLDPDPVRRPTLGRIRQLLDPDANPRTPLPESPPDDAEDLFTLPLAIAAQAGVVPRLEPDDLVTEVRPTLVDPDPPIRPQDGFGAAGRVNPLQEDFWDDHWHDHRNLPPQGWVGPPPLPPPSRAERARRGVLLVAAGVAAAAGIAAYPYPSMAVLLLLAWLLRSGSMAASATGDRQRMRGGTRWYDVVLVPLSAPWHLLRSIPTTALLYFWAGGFAVAAALLCYAFSVSTQLTLFIAGLALVGALYLGPGGSRVRRPLSRLVIPLSRSTPTWSVAVAVVVVAAIVLGLISEAGVHWLPADGRPGS